MIKFLAKIFIKDYKNTENAEVRRKYGILAGAVGIALNVLLFVLKLAAGIFTGSVAVMADAFNNISDAGSSGITMIGFRLAGKKPDPEHPFGHGRIEYITGFIVSILIFVMGFELATSSFEAIKNPKQTELSPLSLTILALSVIIKLYMYFYNHRYGKKLNSAAMKATASDSLSDTVSTLAVIASLLFAHFTDLLIDGYVGLAVAAFILLAGFRAAKETIEPLLGVCPDKELMEEISNLILLKHPITGVHDMILHDYGPGRQFLSLHAEVPMDENILFVHDVIDNVEIEIFKEYGIETVIHMDPIDTRDQRINDIRSKVKEILSDLGEGFNAHDFRIVPGHTHTNVLFDVVRPIGSKIGDEELKTAVSLAVSAMDPQYRCVIKIDSSYS